MPIQILTAAVLFHKYAEVKQYIILGNMYTHGSQSKHFIPCVWLLSKSQIHTLHFLGKYHMTFKAFRKKCARPIFQLFFIQKATMKIWSDQPIHADGLNIFSQRIPATSTITSKAQLTRLSILIGHLLPSGKRSHNHGTFPFSMGNLTSNHRFP